MQRLQLNGILLGMMSLAIASCAGKTGGGSSASSPQQDSSDSVDPSVSTDPTDPTTTAPTTTTATGTTAGTTSTGTTATSTSGGTVPLAAITLGSPSMPGTTTSTVTSYQITCGNGSTMSGNYSDHETMCAALVGTFTACPAALSFYDSNCATSSSSATTTTGPVTTSTTTSGSGTETSFNLTCAGGSNYNGTYVDHGTMCLNLETKIALCPPAAANLYSQLCN